MQQLDLEGEAQERRWEGHKEKGWQFYSQTITDADTLKKFEAWFSNAEYIFSGTDCGKERACLELTLANGAVVKMSMATDDCPNFSIDGVGYDYP